MRFDRFFSLCADTMTLGHVYTIGECGGAMEESRCPECRATVGGSQHRLADGNRVASEFTHFVRN